MYCVQSSVPRHAESSSHACMQNGEKSAAKPRLALHHSVHASALFHRMPHSNSTAQPSVHACDMMPPVDSVPVSVAGSPVDDESPSEPELPDPSVDDGPLDPVLVSVGALVAVSSVGSPESLELPAVWLVGAVVCPPDIVVIASVLVGVPPELPSVAPDASSPVPQAIAAAKVIDAIGVAMARACACVASQISRIRL
jgi:hypothetical protein